MQLRAVRAKSGSNKAIIREDLAEPIAKTASPVAAAPSGRKEENWVAPFQTPPARVPP